jgi:LDH2 family malate/lactate/ureidoglycolate dehydrogenase
MASRSGHNKEEDPVKSIAALDLRSRINGIFRALGASQEVSEQVARSLVESNLAGHDSHGVIRVPWYVQATLDGAVHPNAEIRVVRESASTALLDCGFGLGQVAATRGMELAMAKARQHDIGMVVLQHCGHIGRLGEYVVTAAQQGMMGTVYCNGSRPNGLVAPYGGVATALGANPIAWGIPGAGEGDDIADKPVFLDYATSACAQGKIAVARDEGKAIPEGWLLDKNGRPTTDPNDQVDGGVMLPFGKHKGYCMGTLIELACSGIAGVGFPMQPGYKWDQGTVLMAVNIEAFQPLGDFRAKVAEFRRRVKETPRAPDCDEILMPGEPEWRSKAQRERDGIPLPEKTWARIGEAAESVGFVWEDMD